jgi:Tol biopolymer transport system component
MRCRNALPVKIVVPSGGPLHPRGFALTAPAATRVVRPVARMNATTALLLTAAMIAGCKGTTAPDNPAVRESLIVYSAAPAGQTDHHLFVVKPDGTSGVELATAPGDKRSPAWSPDGESLVFWLANPYVGLWVSQPDGINAQQVPAQNIGDPRWSPDGQWIIFTADNALGQVLVEALRPDGSGRHTVAPGVDRIMLSPPSWSKNGRVAFMRSSTTVQGDGTIWSANVDGSGLTQLTTGRRDDRPHWSPDGTMMAYTAGGPISTSSPIYVFQAAVVNADGTGQRMLSAWDGVDSFVEDWSPDGKWLLIRRSSGAGCAYYKVPVSGGAAVRVSTIDNYDSCLGASWRN